MKFSASLFITGIIIVVIGIVIKAYDVLLIGASMFIIGLCIFVCITKHKEKKAKKKREEYNDRFLWVEIDAKSMSKYRGLDKYHAMNNINPIKSKEGADAIRQVGVLLQQSVYKEKEKDWATLGGIADGIAGPVAGIATAVSVMQENERIRQDNAARAEWGKQKKAEMFNLANSYENESSKIRRISMKDIKEKYRADFWQSPADFLTMLELETVKIEPYTYCDSVIIETKWRCKEKICIDGSIRAKLYDTNGLYVGCAYLILPSNGTSSTEGIIRSVCAKPLSQNIAKVEYEAISLWELSETNSPEKTFEYPSSEAEAYLVQCNKHLEEELEQTKEKYKEINAENKKKIKKIILKLSVILLSAASVTALLVIGFTKLNDSKLNSIASEYIEVCNDSLADVLNDYDGISDFEVSITDVEKWYSGAYVATLRIDFTVNINDFATYNFLGKKVSNPDYLLVSDVLRIVPEKYVTDNGDEIYFYNYNSKSDYCYQDMVYIYLNGEVECQPRSISDRTN